MYLHQIESTILIKVDIAIIRMTSSILASFFLQLMKNEIPDFVIESKLIYSVSQFIFTQNSSKIHHYFEDNLKSIYNVQSDIPNQENYNLN